MTTNLNSSALWIESIISSNHKSKRLVARPSVDPSDMMRSILPEELFLGMLCLDRKRAERSGRKLFLVLLDAEDAVKSGGQEILRRVAKAADAARRETDPAGWYKQNCVLGIIFAEFGSPDDQVTTSKLVHRIREALVLHLTPEDLRQVHLTIHVFGDDSGDQERIGSANPTFYPDLFHQQALKKVSRLSKRAMDVGGSMAALILLSPLFLLIAVLVKLSSKGPVLFKQERLGQLGEKFKCLKFRTMYSGSDPKIHREFMKRVINGGHDGRAEGSTRPVYKMTNDPRITRIGRILRRTSLDELPQFLNVLKGDMSLVGPRPPLEYEYKEYDIWHRRRVLEIKPGITGLWQVRGRSRVRFDDMVRLDLQYMREWSLWLDIRILMATPRAVVSGDGAY